jgi:hypothetical protein
MEKLRKDLAFTCNWGEENIGNMVNASKLPTPKYQLTPWHCNLNVANHMIFEELLERSECKCQ